MISQLCPRSSLFLFYSHTNPKCSLGPSSRQLVVNFWPNCVGLWRARQRSGAHKHINSQEGPTRLAGLISPNAAQCGERQREAALARMATPTEPDLNKRKIVARGSGQPARRRASSGWRKGANGQAPAAQVPSQFRSRTVSRAPQGRNVHCGAPMF